MKRSINPILAAFVVVGLFMLSCGVSIDFGESAPSQPSATPTEFYTPTATQAPTNTPQPTMTPNVVATQKVQNMKDLADQFASNGYIPSAAGDYFALPAFTKNWAQIGWYQWYENTDFSLTNFIIKVDLEWETALATSDPSGCGFVFRLQENDDHYLIFLSVDGYLYGAVNATTNKDLMGNAYWGPKAPSGRANLILLANDSTFRVFVNDKLVKTFYGMKFDLLTGQFAYTIVSGTNKDYGTRCTFTNAAIWSLK